jgi:hypothetical protein
MIPLHQMKKSDEYVIPVEDEFGVSVAVKSLFEQRPYTIVLGSESCQQGSNTTCVGTMGISN